jgi:hypothetical protein
MTPKKCHEMTTKKNWFCEISVRVLLEEAIESQKKQLFLSEKNPIALGKRTLVLPKKCNFVPKY